MKNPLSWVRDLFEREDKVVRMFKTMKCHCGRQLHKDVVNVDSVEFVCDAGHVFEILTGPDENLKT